MLGTRDVVNTEHAPQEVPPPPSRRRSAGVAEEKAPSLPRKAVFSPSAMRLHAAAAPSETYHP